MQHNMKMPLIIDAYTQNTRINLQGYNGNSEQFYLNILTFYI